MDAGTTVLIVDDDISLRNLLKSIIAKMGYNVTEATNPVQAFGILKSVTPQLIILDMLMPVMDGAAMLEQLRKNEDWKHIPVIVCTSLSTKETVLKFASLGVHEFLLKPFETGTAIQKIRKAIQKAEESKAHASNGVSSAPVQNPAPKPVHNEIQDIDPEITIELSDKHDGESNAPSRTDGDETKE